MIIEIPADIFCHPIIVPHQKIGLLRVWHGLQGTLRFIPAEWTRALPKEIGILVQHGIQRNQAKVDYVGWVVGRCMRKTRPTASGSAGSLWVGYRFFSEPPSRSLGINTGQVPI